VRFDELIAASGAVDIVDAPLTDQLSTVAGCDVSVSPHSGFGMAALAVGTPWLSIAGNRWPEYYFNGVPFYSVMPDINRFPCYTLLEADPPMVSEDGPRSPSMCTEWITQDLPAIVEGVARLVEGRWDHPTALADHFDRLLRLREGSTEGIWSVDDLHRR
jgi:hypothetical protein